MTFTALTCPQCAAPLPRAAYWRTVTCVYCGATVTRNAETVRADDFHRAFVRVHSSSDQPARIVAVGDRRYAVMGTLGAGATSQVLLARRRHPFAERVTLKISHAEGRSNRLQREAEVLAALQTLTTPGAAYFSQRLPQVVHFGLTQNGGEPDRQALVLRAPTGYWGDLAAAAATQGGLIDPRHIVWIWRRVLELLAWLHDNGWTHGGITPAHLLVHAPHHGVQLIGWADARRGGQPARDLRQLAWSLRALLGNTPDDDDRAPRLPASVPAPLAALLTASSEDPAFNTRHGAADLQNLLSQAALEAFGPPRFLPLSLT